MNEMSKRTLKAIPEDFPVRPLTTRAEIDAAGDPMWDLVCGLWWDDMKATAYSPVPAGRCPFEGFHADEADAGKGTMKKTTVQLEVTVEIDADDWKLEYGVTEEQLPAVVAGTVKYAFYEANCNFKKVTVKEKDQP